jgi:ribonuclease G
VKREILINSAPRETRVAILEDDQLVELLVERPDARRMLGDVYLGKVEAVLPGIQAAFVNIGTEKSAFLHASDVVFDEGADPDDEPDDEDDDEPADADAAAPNAPPRAARRRAKAPPIEEVLKKGQELLVQITKEPISTKGPRVTAQLSFAGRFLVYMPHAPSRVGVSRKITDRDDRRRLKEMVGGVLPPGAGGVIVRTVSEDASAETFGRELTSLANLWKRLQRKMRFMRAPAMIHQETNLTRGLVRDLFSDKVDRFVVDSRALQGEVLEYLGQVAPELAERVHLHDEVRPLFDRYGIEPEIRDLFKRRCDLPSGGYLIIEPTEALVSIDVNSGRFVGRKEKDPEKTVLRTNVEAAREVARQLRLRDVGGIIVCDFIDMEMQVNRDRVLQELRQHLARDRARTKAYAVSELGLVEMTRQRVRQSHLQSMTAPCPTCAGTGRLFTPETVVRRLERSVRRIAAEGKREPLQLRMHPETALHVLTEEHDLMRKLEKLVGFTLEMRDDPLLKPDEFKLVVKGAERDVTEQYAVA